MQTDSGARAPRHPTAFTDARPEFGFRALSKIRLRACVERIVFAAFLRFRRVPDPVKADVSYYFPTSSKRSYKRAKKFATKEPGTIKWLDASLQEGDVFFDIGANMGIYSAFAASRIGDGVVYAFEPHAQNFTLLTETIALNGLAGVIRPLSLALGARSELQPFYYSSLVSGSSGSQVEASPMAVTESILYELKFCECIDSLIEQPAFSLPNLVKIDVDGNELNILRGMEKVLSAGSIRSMQVESDPSLDKAIRDFLGRFGYRESARHFSSQGQKIHDLGRPYPANVIYVKA